MEVNGGQECASGSGGCLLQGIKEAQPVVAEVVGEELKGLLKGKNMAQCNEAFLEAHGSASLAHRAAAARMMVLLDPGAKPAAAKMLVKRGGLIGADRPPSHTHTHKASPAAKMLVKRGGLAMCKRLPSHTKGTPRSSSPMNAVALGAHICPPLVL